MAGRVFAKKKNSSLRASQHQGAKVCLSPSKLRHNEGVSSRPQCRRTYAGLKTGRGYVMTSALRRYPLGARHDAEPAATHGTRTIGPPSRPRGRWQKLDERSDILDGIIFYEMLTESCPSTTTR